MLTFRDPNGHLVGIPWHVVQEVRIVKRFPMQPEVLDGAGFSTVPFYYLVVNGNVIARYADIHAAESEFLEIANAICVGSAYRIQFALSEKEYLALLQGIQAQRAPSEEAGSERCAES